MAKSCPTVALSRNRAPCQPAQRCRKASNPFDVTLPDPVPGQDKKVEIRAAHTRGIFTVFSMQCLKQDAPQQQSPCIAQVRLCQEVVRHEVAAQLCSCGGIRRLEDRPRLRKIAVAGFGSAS